MSDSPSSTTSTETNYSFLSSTSSTTSTETNYSSLSTSSTTSTETNQVKQLTTKLQNLENSFCTFYNTNKNNLIKIVQILDDSFMTEDLSQCTYQQLLQYIESKLLGDETCKEKLLTQIESNE